MDAQAIASIAKVVNTAARPAAQPRLPQPLVLRRNLTMSGGLLCAQEAGVAVDSRATVCTLDATQWIHLMDKSVLSI